MVNFEKAVEAIWDGVSEKTRDNGKLRVGGNKKIRIEYDYGQQDNKGRIRRQMRIISQVNKGQAVYIFEVVDPHPHAAVVILDNCVNPEPVYLDHTDEPVYRFCRNAQVYFETLDDMMNFIEHMDDSNTWEKAIEKGEN